MAVTPAPSRVTDKPACGRARLPPRSARL